MEKTPTLFQKMIERSLNFLIHSLLAFSLAITQGILTQGQILQNQTEAVNREPVLALTKQEKQELRAKLLSFIKWGNIYEFKEFVSNLQKKPNYKELYGKFVFLVVVYHLTDWEGEGLSEYYPKRLEMLKYIVRQIENPADFLNQQDWIEATTNVIVSHNSGMLLSGDKDGFLEKFKLYKELVVFLVSQGAQSPKVDLSKNDGYFRTLLNPIVYYYCFDSSKNNASQIKSIGKELLFWLYENDQGIKENTAYLTSALHSYISDMNYYRNMDLDMDLVDWFLERGAALNQNIGRSDNFFFYKPDRIQ